MRAFLRTGAVLGLAILCLGIGDCGPTLEATLETPASPSRGAVAVSFRLVGAPDKTGAVELEVSDDGGLSWTEATISGPTEGLALAEAPGASHTVSWDSLADVGAVRVDVLLRLTPRLTNETLDAVTSDVFTVDNASDGNLPPSVLILDPPASGVDQATYHGHVALHFKLSDPDGDACSVTFTVSDDGGATFRPATLAVPDPTSGLAAPADWATYSLLWDSAADLPGPLTERVVLRLEVADGAPGGEARTTELTVDNGALVNARGPYLQDATADGVLVVWTTGQRTTSRIALGPDPDHLDTIVEDRTLTTLHVVRLTGLSPGATTHYRASSSGTEVAAATFRTAPPPGTPFTFLAFGDCGTGSSKQYAVAEQMDKVPADLAVIAGDIVYPTGAQSDYTRNFFAPYKSLGARTVLYATVGNHDLMAKQGAAFYENFYLPTNNPDKTEKWYSFDWGDVHFVSLYTAGGNAVPPDHPQGVWLAADLAASTRRWKVVFMHFPMYSSGYHGSLSLLQEHLTPVFVANGVDLVIVGHDHHYERLGPIDGIQHILTGGGGKSLRKPFKKIAPSVVIETKHHFTRIKVSTDRIELDAIGTDGEVFDRHVMTK